MKCPTSPGSCPRRAKCAPGALITARRDLTLTALALNLAFLSTAHCYCITYDYSNPSTPTRWAQLGDFIPVDSNTPVGFNADGSQLHVGSRVYIWSKSHWKLIRGNDVAGETHGSAGGYYDSYSGTFYSYGSSSMSSDGSHVTFGKDNKVRVYE